jgi:hypothetical protein
MPDITTASPAADEGPRVEAEPAVFTALTAACLSTIVLHCQANLFTSGVGPPMDYQFASIVEMR